MVLSHKFALYANPQGGNVTEGLIAKLHTVARRFPVKLFLPRSLDEGMDHVQEILEGKYKIAGLIGGDGTISAVRGMVQSLQRKHEILAELPPLALFKGGTGNGLHRLVGASKKIVKPVRGLLRKLEKGGSLDTIDIPSIDVVATDNEGRKHEASYPFAGGGVEARILEDFQSFKRDHPNVPNLLAYLIAGFTRALPRERNYEQPFTEMYTDDAVVEVLRYEGRKIHHGRNFTVDKKINLMKIISPGNQRPLSVVMGTTPLFGFGFRAIPCAEYAVKNRMMGVRVLTPSAGEFAWQAARHPFDAWAGEYVDGTRDVALRHVRLVYPEKPQQFQVAGTPIVSAVEVDARVSNDDMKLVDYKKLQI